MRLDHRSSARLVEAAQRLGEMLRSDNLQTAMWADEVIKRHILPETSKHTSRLAGWYSQSGPSVGGARAHSGLAGTPAEGGGGPGVFTLKDSREARLPD